LTRILAYTSPFAGHLFPVAAILEELRSRGHQVSLRTLASEVETFRSLGFEAAPISAEIEALDPRDWQGRSRLGRSRRAILGFRERAAYDARDLQEAIEEVRPEALLVDIACWGALFAAEAWDGPWASFCPFPLPRAALEAPEGFGPRAVFGRARLAPNRALEALGDRMLLPQMNELRAGFGLAPLERAGALFERPPLLLYMSSEAFDYPRSDWPENIVTVGPCVWEPPGSLPPELERIEAPLVLVSTSSAFQDDGELVRCALQALAEEPCHVVATIPATRTPLPSPPKNATVVRRAPHRPILARAICAITHGGMGVTQKALSQGIPVCVVPFGRDQFEVARRVEAAGAGSRLPAGRLRPDRLRAKFREALSCGPGAERVARGFAAAGGATSAADAFERRVIGMDG
jgi:MGT family glycosyltransferase